MAKKRIGGVALVLLLFILAAGCATPVRDAVKLDQSVPLGKIEGSKFTGERFPFNVAAPAGWEISTTFPKFMLDLGFDKEGLEESQVFVYNPATQSNLQVDLTPAGRYSTFNQKSIEWLVSAAEGSFIEELQKEFGMTVQAEVSKTVPHSLKGVPYAAKKYAAYTAKGSRREQGWIYAFAEPFQIFILYMVMDRTNEAENQAMQAIIDSFEYVMPPKK